MWGGGVIGYMYIEGSNSETIEDVNGKGSVP